MLLKQTGAPKTHLKALKFNFQHTDISAPYNWQVQRVLRIAHIFHAPLTTRKNSIQLFKQLTPLETQKSHKILEKFPHIAHMLPKPVLRAINFKKMAIKPFNLHRQVTSKPETPKIHPTAKTSKHSNVPHHASEDH
jgi:hypothetical protein